MSVELTAAYHYLAAPAGSFWRWSDGGQVISWNDGETILFRAELRVVLGRLAPAGLPAFDEILLLLSACRNSWRPSSVLFEVPWSDGENPGDPEATLPTWLTDLVAGLKKIHELPAPFRDSPEAKSLLAEVVLEDRPRIVAAASAGAVLELLDSGPGADAGWMSGDWTLSSAAVQNSLQQLAVALRRVDEELLRRRRQTGLDDELLPADISPVDPSEGVRELLARLSDDDEVGGMVRLARQLIAVVQLPRAVSDPEELPIGGVSDIANRGTLDRLLLSELAHDDLTLSVRVAVNEALYLRRESPPKSPPEQRVTLIDVGLRLWGVPRLFAASVALALAANSPRDGQAAYRSQGEVLALTPLTHREGLMSLLGSLDPALDCAAALPAFAERLKRMGNGADAMIVTSAETYEDPSFQRALADVDLPAIYVATVRRDGEFRLWRQSPRGRRCLREARLDLNDILRTGTERPPRPLIDPAIPSHLPAICRIRPFPVRLPHRIDADNTVRIDTRTLLAFTRDGRLMRWNDVDKGAEQVAEDLPLGELIWCDSFEEDRKEYRFLVAPRSSRSVLLVFVDLANGRSRVVPLDWRFGRPLQAFADGGRLVLRQLWEPTYRMYDGESGEFLEWRRFAEGGYVAGARFTASLGDQFSLSCCSVIGGQLRSVAVPIHEAVRTVPEIASLTLRHQVFGHLVERPGHDGPFLVSRATGELVCLTHGTRRPLSAGMATPVFVHGFDRDGRRALVHAGPQPSQIGSRPVGTGQLLVDLETGRRTIVAPHVVSIAQWDAALFAFPRIVRKRFRAVLPTGGPSLILVAHSGACWRLSLEEGRIFLKLVAQRSVAEAKPFQPLSRPRRAYAMSKADFQGGRVFLDSRGLLHLQSDDPKIPEATLILAPDEVSGWCADGRTWGDRYFFASAPTAKPAIIFHEVVQPFARGLR